MPPKSSPNCPPNKRSGDIEPANDERPSNRRKKSLLQNRVYARYTQGDWTLITSDQTTFKIYKYQLMAACPNLCASGDSITFPATDNVTTEVLATFLDYVRNESTETVTSDNLEKLSNVLRSSVKWDSRSVRRNILGDLIRSTHSNARIPPFALFRIAGEFDDLDLAKHAIQAGIEGRSWKRPTGEDPRPELYKERYARNCMDPRTWPIDMFDKVSPLYIGAYLRALLPFDLNNMDQDSWQKLVKRFDDFVELGRQEQNR